MGGRVARATRTWLAVLGVALGVSVLLPATPAAAHNSLTGSDPRDGARLAAAPKRIELRFLATPAPATTKITVTGPDGASGTAGSPTFAGNRVSVPFAPGAAGVYVIGYRVGSTDGHPVTGEIRFTLMTGTPVRSPSAGAPAPTVEAPGATAPTTPAASSAPASPVPAADRRADDGRSGWLWALGAVMPLALIGGGLLLSRRSARR